MSLRDVKVGDVVVTTDVNRKGVARRPVTAIGRKYITVGGKKYEIANGGGTGPYACHCHAYSPAQWARLEAEDVLRAAAHRLENLSGRPFAHLSDDEVRDLTATLNAVAEKMEKK